jgi:hypothetical protein
MKPAIRSLIAALGTFAVFYYVYWVPVAIILEITYGRFQWMWIIRVLGSLIAAAGAAQFTWRRKSWAPQGLIGCVILGAAIMSGVGFSAGWFGPMILDPGSQGPLVANLKGSPAEIPSPEPDMVVRPNQSPARAAQITFLVALSGEQAPKWAAFLGGGLRPAYLRFAFINAHRLRCAAAIRALPAAEIVRVRSERTAPFVTTPSSAAIA